MNSAVGNRRNLGQTTVSTAPVSYGSPVSYAIRTIFDFDLCR
jgi:hypothetical protein